MSNEKEIKLVWPKISKIEVIIRFYKITHLVMIEASPQICQVDCCEQWPLHSTPAREEFYRPWEHILWNVDLI